MSSWVLHCGSQHKVPGQSNTDFDLNLNQTLEFPDETKCTVFNVNIPNSVPNVCDAFENKTWQFTFRMYAVAAALARTGLVTGQLAYNNYTVDNKVSGGLLHSEVTLTVSVPDGNYQFSNNDTNFTENTYINEIADEIVTHIQVGSGASTASTDISAPATGAAILWSQLYAPSSRYGVTTGDRNRTYIEALQKAIRKAQQQMRVDSLSAPYDTWTDPNAAPTAAQLVSNENYKKRILKFLVSDMYISVQANANHQPEFIIKSNFSNGNVLANHANVLANAFFFPPAGTIPFTGSSSGALTAGWMVNPWMTLAAVNGAPTHFIQAKITAPNNIRFQGRHAMNCLDFYVNQFFPILSTTAVGANRILIGDVHPVAVAAQNESNAGNFTPYGYTWNSFPITESRSDVFKTFVVQDGTGGWFPCCYFGVRCSANDVTAQVAQYMYAPVYFSGTPYLCYINDLAFNHRTKTNPIQAGTTALYPVGGANVGVPANNEMSSTVFTGMSVFVSSAALASDSTYYIGPANFSKRVINIPTMDYESNPTFIIEIEMFGSGNHMKFTGSGECKRVKIVKRMSFNDLTYGGFIRNNVDGQSTLDYGTCLGLSKVSSIKCRILNEKGEIINLNHTDSFPQWTFSLVFS